MGTLGIADNHWATGSYPLPVALCLGIADMDTQNFWRRVIKSDGCWLWTGAKHPDPGGAYGYLYAGKGVSYKVAHRYAWEITFGPIPDGMLVCHRCDVRLCVRPDHLFIGTIADNMADRNAKGRQAYGERLGSARLTEAEVIAIRTRYARGGVLYRELASEYGISPVQIGHIVTRRKWKHLP